MTTIYCPEDAPGGCEADAGLGCEGHPDGVSLIDAERDNQVYGHGFTARHDAEHHGDGSLLEAAHRYLVYGGYIAQGRIPTEDELGPGPDWGDGWFRPDATDAKPNLVKAAALIAAELDRMIRAELAEDVEARRHA